MIVALADIPTRGLVLALAEMPWARAAAADGLGGEVRAFDGGLTVTRHGVHVAVRGEISAMALVPCDRCRAPMLVSVGGEVSCLYSPLSALPEREGDDDGLPRPPVELPFEVLDVGEYSGTSIDLAEVVREWMLVERPARMVCADVDPHDDAACLERFRASAGPVAKPPVDPRLSILSKLSVKD